MREDAVLINAARGAVVDNQALLKTLKLNKIKAAILDVWENEPSIELDLLGHLFLGTPHIAGYSLDGKLNGTEIVLNACCEFFELKAKPFVNRPIQEKPFLLGMENQSEKTLLQKAIRHFYPIQADFEKFKTLLKKKGPNTGSLFDELRKNYPVRREFFTQKIKIQNSSFFWPQVFSQLGFQSDSGPK